MHTPTTPRGVHTPHPRTHMYAEEVECSAVARRTPLPRRLDVERFSTLTLLPGADDTLRERVAVMILHLQVRRALRDTLPTTGQAQDLRACHGHLGALPAGGFLRGGGSEHRAG